LRRLARSRNGCCPRYVFREPCVGPMHAHTSAYRLVRLAVCMCVCVWGGAYLGRRPVRWVVLVRRPPLGHGGGLSRPQNKNGRAGTIAWCAARRCHAGAAGQAAAAAGGAPRAGMACGGGRQQLTDGAAGAAGGRSAAPGRATHCCRVWRGGGRRRHVSRHNRGASVPALCRGHAHTGAEHV
jgi:hypothetical protein